MEKLTIEASERRWEGENERDEKVKDKYNTHKKSERESRRRRRICSEE